LTWAGGGRAAWDEVLVRTPTYGYPPATGTHRTGDLGVPTGPAASTTGVGSVSRHTRQQAEPWRIEQPDVAGRDWDARLIVAPVVERNWLNFSGVEDCRCRETPMRRERFKDGFLQSHDQDSGRHLLGRAGRVDGRKPRCDGGAPAWGVARAS
jgi:hypothetical protein